MSHPASKLDYTLNEFDNLIECLTSWFGPAGPGWSIVKLNSAGHLRIEVPAGDLYVRPGDQVWIKATSVVVVVK